MNNSLSVEMQKWNEQAHIGAGYSQQANVVENYIDLALVAEWAKRVQELEHEVAGLDADYGTLLKERNELERELDGDGTHDPDPLKGLGLRQCYELRGEHIALLEREVAELKRGKEPETADVYFNSERKESR